MKKTKYQAIVYARVSTDDQAEKGYSLEGQIDDCLKKAYLSGYNEDRILVLTDDVSGKYLDRPGLNKLRELVRGDEKPEVVIIYDPDRLARNLTYQLVLTDEIINNGVALEFVNFEWENTPEGKMFYQLRGMFAEFERAKIRERTIRGRMTKIEKHGKLSYDPRLYGYQFDTEEDVLIVHPEESKIVQLIFQLCASGSSGEEIARLLAQDGIPAPRGNKWYGATITRIIRNKSYLGTYMAYKVDYHQGYKRDRPETEQFPIPIDQLVDEETFQKANMTLEKNRTNSGRPSSREYLLSGLGYCYCGKKMNASTKSGNREYTYYSCVAKHKVSYKTGTGEEIGRCKSSLWNSSVVDEVVWEKIKNVIDNPIHLIDELIEQKSKREKETDDQTLELPILKVRYENIEKQKNKLLDLYLSDEVEKDIYTKKMNSIKKDLNHINLRISEIEKDITNKEISEKQLKDKINSLTKYRKELNKVSFKKKQKIVHKLIQRVIFQNNREVTIVFNVNEKDVDNNEDGETKINSRKSNHSESNGRPAT